jgi:hypothetical protein
MYSNFVSSSIRILRLQIYFDQNLKGDTFLEIKMPFRCANVRDSFRYHYRNGPRVHSDRCPLHVCNNLTYGIEYTYNTDFNITISWYWYAFKEILYTKM